MIQRLVKYMVWQKIFCQWQILKSYFLWQNLLWLCRKGTTLYFSMLKIFCRPKTSYLKFWLFSAQSKIFLWPFGLKWYHRKCWQKFLRFSINFDDSNTCQVYGLTENFLSMTDSIIIFSVTKTTLTLEKKGVSVLKIFFRPKTPFLKLWLFSAQLFH